MFSKYVIREVAFSSTSRIRSFFGELKIEGVRVEIMGDVQHLLEDSSWDGPSAILGCRQIVDLEGIGIRVLPLEYELKAYRRLKRADKVEAIERKLIFEAVE